MEYQGGGALFGENISLSENAGVLTFKDNIVKTFASNGKILGGGAILATGKVEITNNSGGISFTGNARAPQALPTQEEFPLFSKKKGGHSLQDILGRSDFRKRSSYSPQRCSSI